MIRTLSAIAGLALTSSLLCAAPHAQSLEEVLLAALKADPTDASTMMRLGVLLHASGQDAEGAALIESAYAIDPSLITDLFIDTPAPRGGTICPSATGPDVIVGDIPSTALAAHEGPSQNGISAFGIGTTSCNVGDQVLLWQSSNLNHPVIAQNIYRYAEGRITQVGVGWLKHGFLALSGNVCCSCTGPGGSQLSPGCSDPYSAGLNASQGRLGPRFEVNAATGAFPYPFTSPSYRVNTIDRRCQAADADLDPARNPGARYFVEGHYIANDDAAAGNDNNNASYREVAFSASGAGFAASNVGPTVRELPAIKAWPVAQPGATVIDVDVPGDGRFHVGFAATDRGDGTWRYEYAIHNLSSDRSAQAFTLPVPASVNLSDLYFHDVTYHSGEPMDGTDWTFARVGNNATWSTLPFAVSADANALRWGTLYNFGFTADAPPATIASTITLFKPGAIPSVAAAVAGPANLCPADLNGDGEVTAADLAQVLAGWGAPGAGDLDGDGTVGASDLAVLLAAWGPC